MQEAVLDEAGHHWFELEREDRRGGGFLLKRLADGEEGPAAVLSIQPAGFENPSHFHSRAQFQVVLEGTVTFPGQPQQDALLVHFSDAYTPYGPFVVGDGFKMAVLRTGPSEQIYMSDRIGRARRDPDGRECYGHCSLGAWDPDVLGPRTLFSCDDGLSAVLQQYSPGTAISSEPSSNGTYEVVVRGSAVIDDQEIAPYSMRYSCGDGRSRGLRAGAHGALLLSLTFPADDAS